MPMTNDGTQLEVSTDVPATFDTLGYEALTLTTVGEVVDIGEIGADYADITSFVLARRAVNHYKGSRDWGETPITVENEKDDAGQVILKDHHNGAKIDDQVSFAVTRQNGDKLYFTALVYTFKDQSIAQDSMYRASVTIRIVDESVVEAPAA